MIKDPICNKCLMTEPEGATFSRVSKKLCDTCRLETQKEAVDNKKHHKYSSRVQKENKLRDGYRDEW